MGLIECITIAMSLFLIVTVLVLPSAYFFTCAAYANSWFGRIGFAFLALLTMAIAAGGMAYLTQHRSPPPMTIEYNEHTYKLVK